METHYYYSYYIFGLIKDKPIWDWEIWNRCIIHLDPIVNLSPELPTIKSNQSIPVKVKAKENTVSYNKGTVRFGKMIWNEENNKKWTTKYCKEKDCLFFDAEISYPSRNTCRKTNQKPLLLIIVHNENLGGSKNPNVEQSLTIHINSLIINKEELAEIERHIVLLSEQMKRVRFGKMYRPYNFENIWMGTYGVLNYDTNNFNENYLKNGIVEII